MWFEKTIIYVWSFERLKTIRSDDLKLKKCFSAKVWILWSSKKLVVSLLDNKDKKRSVSWKCQQKNFKVSLSRNKWICHHSKKVSKKISDINLNVLFKKQQWQLCHIFCHLTDFSTYIYSRISTWTFEFVVWFSNTTIVGNNS